MCAFLVTASLKYKISQFRPLLHAREAIIHSCGEIERERERERERGRERARKRDRMLVCVCVLIHRHRYRCLRVRDMYTHACLRKS
jgi:hypothetical protein